MRRRENSSALLVELLIVILFFMIAAPVLLRLFFAVHEKNQRAEDMSVSVLESQNLAEQLYAAEDPAVFLRDHGFREDGEDWVSEGDGITTRVSLSREETVSGILHRAAITVWQDGELLLTLPWARFTEAKAEFHESGGEGR